MLAFCALRVISSFVSRSFNRAATIHVESRKRLINVIEFKEWWYVPDKGDPTEIRVSVIVHQSGRFGGNVTGEQTERSAFWFGPQSNGLFTPIPGRFSTCV